MSSSFVNPETAVRDDESPEATCRYCGRPFDTERSCSLHVGEAHADEWTEQEQIAYEDAVAAEEDELWLYHIKIVAALGVTYAVIVLVYMVVLG